MDFKKFGEQAAEAFFKAMTNLGQSPLYGIYGQYHVPPPLDSEPPREMSIDEELRYQVQWGEAEMRAEARRMRIRNALGVVAGGFRKWFFVEPENGQDGTSSPDVQSK